MDGLFFLAPSTKTTSMKILVFHFSCSKSWISSDGFFLSIEYSFKCILENLSCFTKGMPTDFQFRWSYWIFWIDFYLNAHSALQCTCRALCRSRTRREGKCTFSACSDSASLSPHRRGLFSVSFYLSIYLFFFLSFFLTFTFKLE